MDEKMMRVGIGADVTQFTDAMKGVERTAAAAADKLQKEFADKASSGIDRLEARFRTMSNFLAAGISVAALKNVGAAYLEQDRALTDLAASYNSAGIYSGALMKRTEELAAAMQREANAGDEAVEAGIALMVTIGKMGERDIPAATRAAVGLSKALKIDMDTAFKLVGKAAAGNTSALSRYGVVLGDNLTAEQKFQKVLSEGAKWFDIAKEKAGDATGRYEQFGIQVGEAKEALGAFAGSDLGLGAITLVTNAIRNATDYINNFGIASKLAMIEAEKAFVKASGTLSKWMILSPATPGVQNAGITSDLITKNVDYQLRQLEKRASSAVDEYEKKLESIYKKPTASINVPVDVELEPTSIKMNKGNLYIYDAEDFRRTVRRALSVEDVYNPKDRTADARAMQDALDKMEVGPELPEWRRAQIDYEKQAQTEATDAMMDQMDRLSEGSRRFYAEMMSDRLDMARGWADTMYEMFESADWSFDKIGKQFDSMIKGMLARGAITGLFNAALGGPGGFTGGFMSAITGRAGGGSIDAGRPYWVGENGRELIIPKTSGTVVPSSKIVSASNVTHDDHSTVNIYIPKGENVKGMDARRFAELYNQAKRDGHIGGRA